MCTRNQLLSVGSHGCSSARGGAPRFSMHAAQSRASASSSASMPGHHTYRRATLFILALPRCPWCSTAHAIGLTSAILIVLSLRKDPAESRTGNAVIFIKSRNQRQGLRALLLGALPACSPCETCEPVVILAPTLDQDFPAGSYEVRVQLNELQFTCTQTLDADAELGECDLDRAEVVLAADTLSLVVEGETGGSASIELENIDTGALWGVQYDSIGLGSKFFADSRRGCPSRDCSQWYASGTLEAITSSSTSTASTAPANKS